MPPVCICINCLGQMNPSARTQYCSTQCRAAWFAAKGVKPDECAQTGCTKEAVRGRGRYCSTHAKKHEGMQKKGQSKSKSKAAKGLVRGGQQGVQQQKQQQQQQEQGHARDPDDQHEHEHEHEHEHDMAIEGGNGE